MTDLSRRLRSRVVQTIRERALVAAGERLAIALSGGPDSVALLWLLRDLSQAGHPDIDVAGIIHVNHGLRGVHAEADEAFCRDLAARLSLPFESARFDVAALAREARRSLESTARDVRYRFFEDACGRLGAHLVATGHTLDDQAETVLLRLLRGAGARGVAGIRYRRGHVIRPVLDCRRNDLREFLAQRGEPFCEDASNTDLTIPRNRVRHRLLPAIEEVAPGGAAALARFAAQAADDEDVLVALANAAAPGSVSMTEAGVQLDGDCLAAQPPAVARRVIRRALEMVRPNRAVTSRHLDAVLRMAGRRVSGALDLAGVHVEWQGHVGRITAGGSRREKPGAFEVPLPVPGRVAVPAAGVSIEARRLATAPTVSGESSAASTVLLQAGALTLPLRVRSRRPGDRLQPLGAPGHRKLQDVLVDRKVSRADRDRLPIVVDAAERIVWVAGVTIAEECRVTEPAAGVVVLELRILA